SILRDLYDSFRAREQADDEWLCEMLDLCGNRDAGNERDVGRFYPAIGKVNRRRGFRRTRHADQHHLCLLEVLYVLTIVMQHRVIQRIDTLEIFGVQHVLSTDLVRRLSAEIRLKQSQDRAEDG